VRVQRGTENGHRHVFGSDVLLGFGQRRTPSVDRRGDEAQRQWAQRTPPAPAAIAVSVNLTWPIHMQSHLTHLPFVGVCSGFVRHFSAR
jgi:hypothetical protein